MECRWAIERWTGVSPHTFVINLANGELRGYIITPGATGYEAQISLFAPESGARMVASAVRTVWKLHGR